MKDFLYGVVSKDTNKMFDVVHTREAAREIKRWCEAGSRPEKVKIVQYAPVKVVR